MVQLKGSALAIGLGLIFASMTAGSCDPGARVFFLKPYNGATVVSPFRVIFGAELVEVKPIPAGKVPENIGHHDLLGIQLGKSRHVHHPQAQMPSC